MWHKCWLERLISNDNHINCNQSNFKCDVVFDGKGKPEVVPWEKHRRWVENQPAAAQTTTVVQFMIRKWKNLQLRENKADVALTEKID